MCSFKHRGGLHSSSMCAGPQCVSLANLSGSFLSHNNKRTGPSREQRGRFRRKEKVRRYSREKGRVMGFLVHRAPDLYLSCSFIQVEGGVSRLFVNSYSDWTSTGDRCLLLVLTNVHPLWAESSLYIWLYSMRSNFLFLAFDQWLISGVQWFSCW